MSDKLQKIIDALGHYDGPLVRLMEVCGTHTGEIARNGIPSLLSPQIRLIAGPGCPVCVTVSAYIDRLCALCREPRTTVLTFGDLMRVPGSRESLAGARADGGSVEMVYAPADTLRLAQEAPEQRFVFAAVGFETTAPVYAELLEEAVRLDLGNLRLLTSLKTMPQVIRQVAQMEETQIDGFLAPGHVAVITGSQPYEALARELGIPFAISGFGAASLLMSIYTLVRLKGQGICRNLYPEAVTTAGNQRAQELVLRFFEPCDAAWRGMGVIGGSGLRLRDEFRGFDAAGQRDTEQMVEDVTPAGCKCAEVLIGRISPGECPLFGTLCTPGQPHGACMVSEEGSCRSAYEYG